MHDIDCLSGRRDLGYSVGDDLPTKGSRQGALCRVIVCCCFLTYHCERQPILLSRGLKTHSSETRHTTLQPTDRTEMGQPTCQALPTSPPRRTSERVPAFLQIFINRSEQEVSPLANSACAPLEVSHSIKVPKKPRPRPFSARSTALETQSGASARTELHAQ